MCTVTSVPTERVPAPPAGGPTPWAPIPCTVRATQPETADTATLEIEPPDGFAFSAGQFNMLTVFGVGEVPISISGDPAAPAPLVHTVRAVGAVTRALVALRSGQTVGVRGPFGSTWPLELAVGSDVVIVGGGLGLAPLRPAISGVFAARARYRRVSVLYGARTPSDLLYPGDLTAWRARFDVDVEVTVDSAGSSWRGDVGVVPSLIDRAVFDPERVFALVCGPEVMMRFTLAALRARGVADERIFISMERNMRCAIGLCGHCQLGPMFVCKDGPVLAADRVASWMGIREL